MLFEPGEGAGEAGESPVSSPESKRARGQGGEGWEMWESSPLRRLREAGDGLDIVPDPDAVSTRLRDAVRDVVLRCRNEYPSWRTLAPSVWGGVLILELAQEATEQDWKGALFRAKILVAVLLDEFRAHERGGYERVGNGPWMPVESLTAVHIEKLEAATRMAIALVAARYDTINDHVAAAP